MPEEVNPEASKSPPQSQLFVYERPARRLELLVRIGYWILIGIVLWVYGLLAFICLFVQWFVILILGRRSMGLSGFIRGYLEYYVHIMPYFYFMTDRRPDIMPVTVRIYEEGLVGEKKAG
jgi:Zn-dependent protease with chaperone function